MANKLVTKALNRAMPDLPWAPCPRWAFSCSTVTRLLSHAPNTNTCPSPPNPSPTWLVCNHAPVVRSDDDAVWRRMLRLPFDNKISEDKRDRGLKVKLTDLTTIGPAILARAVQGCVDWLKNGLQVPTVARQATSEYQTKMNPLVDFVNDECVRHPQAFVPVAEIRNGSQLETPYSSDEIRRPAPTASGSPNKRPINTRLKAPRKTKRTTFVRSAPSANQTCIALSTFVAACVRCWSH